MEKARVVDLEFPAGRRVIAVSDVHGNLPFLKGLLAKIRFDREDILIILGDLLEKGTESLATLRYVMELSRTHTVYTLCGNCDKLLLDLVHSGGERDKSFFDLYYKTWLRRSLLFQMCREAGVEIRGPEDMAEARRMIPQRFPEELAFLEAMPTILRTRRFLFVHGGVPREEDLEELDAWKCMKNDDFLHQGHKFGRWVIVGHWPVTLYHSKVPCAAPLVDRESRIVSIDGGCVLKADGQLNALFLPEEGSEDFAWTAYDGMPVMTALDDQEGSRDSVNIRWGHSALKILERGEELTLCRHEETGRVMPILNDYLYERAGEVRCEDSTDCRLSVTAGERLSVVRRLSDRTLAKKKGVTGWYFGRLEETTSEKDGERDRHP